MQSFLTDQIKEKKWCKVETGQNCIAEGTIKIKEAQLCNGRVWEEELMQNNIWGKEHGITGYGVRVFKFVLWVGL